MGDTLALMTNYEKQIEAHERAHTEANVQAPASVGAFSCPQSC